jgi:hypothetical protein
MNLDQPLRANHVVKLPSGLVDVLLVNEAGSGGSRADLAPAPRLGYGHASLPWCPSSHAR